jgi:hypothetical protein
MRQNVSYSGDGGARSSHPGIVVLASCLAGTPQSGMEQETPQSGIIAGPTLWPTTSVGDASHPGIVFLAIFLRLDFVLHQRGMPNGL